MYLFIFQVNLYISFGIIIIIIIFFIIIILV